MTTPRNRAIYFAKQAFALMQMRGLSAGLIRLDTDGTAEGQRIARAELVRMARAADSAVEMERHAAEARRAAYHDTARAAGI